MVQVDIIWGYAFGATFAASAARQLYREERAFSNPVFTYNLLFLATLFAPSGIYLLWQFPHWETMQLADKHTDIPAWLVVLFAITNVTQGILGYWIGYRFIRKGRFYAAHLNWIIAWFLFWSFLVLGWDGTGWQRFLYDPTVNNGVLWSPGMHQGLGFFSSNVFLTLAVMGVFIGPALTIPVARWIRTGIEKDPEVPKEQTPAAGGIVFWALAGTFGLTLVLAVLQGILVTQLARAAGSVLLGYLIGVPVFWFLLWLLLLRRGWPVHRYARQLYMKTPT